MIDTLTNWSGNIAYSAARLHCPTTVAELQEVVRHAHKLRVLGSRHSFNTIADSDEDLVSLEKLAPQFILDDERSTVTVSAGMTYGQLAAGLHREGYAVHNMASLPHISVAGACATATHGSGDGNGNLATAVTALELVGADGEIVALSREAHGESFGGMVVALGGLGVVTSLTLDVVPAFEMRQDVYEHLPLAALEAEFDAITSSAYSVSLLLDWQTDSVNQVWLKQRVADDGLITGPTFYGATRASRPLHPIVAISAASCTEQLGVGGPWNERLPHFRVEFTPSNGEELQTEYFVPRRHALAAFRVIAGMREQLAPLLQISEIRTIAADTLWMSPCYRQDSVALHFTWLKDWGAVRELLPLLEAGLAPFEARPHWGKLFTMTPERLHALYSRLPEFQQLLQAYDPQGKFRNAFLDTYIFGQAAS